MSDLATVLPEGTVLVTAAERQAQLATPQAGLRPAVRPLPSAVTHQ